MAQSPTENLVACMEHEKENGSQVIRFTILYNRGAFRLNPSVSSLPAKDRTLRSRVSPMGRPQEISVLTQESAGPTGSLRIGPECGQSHPREAKRRREVIGHLLTSALMFPVSTFSSLKKVRHSSSEWKREIIEVIRSVNLVDFFRGGYLSHSGISALWGLSVNQPNVAQALLVVTNPPLLWVVIDIGINISPFFL
ncbi:MAG: hypothetical protein ACW991_03820 [Candidatus Hodarchaeales archaeon]|jgi:hypothetical protein